MSKDNKIINEIDCSFLCPPRNQEHMKFTEWLRYYLEGEWEDYEGNLNDNDMQNAFEAGRLYEAGRTRNKILGLEGGD